MWYIIVIVAVAGYIIYSYSRKKDEPNVEETPQYPEKLLDLDTTTLADRQHAYGRSFRMQQRYDILQRQAERAGDTATLEAIRTNTYDGPLPELESEKTEPAVQELQYFCIKDKGYHVTVWPKDAGMQHLDYIEFPIAGITHRENIGNYIGEHLGTLEEEPDNPYDANAIKILAADGHHDLGGVQGGKDIRFVLRACLVLQGDPGEEYFVAFIDQLIINLLC